MIKNILNLGDAALYCDFGQDGNKEINSSVIKYFNKIQQLKIESINNITPSYNKLIISFDLKKIKYTELKDIIEKIQIDKEDSFKTKIIEINIKDNLYLYKDIDIIRENVKKNIEPYNLAEYILAVNSRYGYINTAIKNNYFNFFSFFINFYWSIFKKIKDRKI